MSCFVITENGEVRDKFSNRLITGVEAEMVLAFSQKGKFEEISESDCWFIIDQRLEEDLVATIQ